MSEENELEFDSKETSTTQKKKDFSHPEQPGEEEIDEIIQKNKHRTAEALAQKILGYGEDLYKYEEEKEDLLNISEVKREQLIYSRDKARRDLIETLNNKLGDQAEGGDPDYLANSESDQEKKKRKRGYSNSSSSDSEIFRGKEYDSEDLDKSDKPIEFGDVKKFGLQVSREMFVQYLDEPFIKKLKGGLVKIMEFNEYKIRLIKEVVQAKKGEEYKVDDIKKFDYRLRLKPDQRKELMKNNIQFVSNQIISEEEFKEYKEEVISLGMELPTVEEAEFFAKKYKEEIIGYKKTDEDVKRMVQRKKSRRKNKYKVANYTRAREDLKRKIEYMSGLSVEKQGEKHDEELFELKSDLEKLEASYKDSIKKRFENSESSKMLEKINDRNLKENMNKEAMLKEKEEDGDNPYARQSCRPKTLWSTRRVDEEQVKVENTPKSGKKEDIFSTREKAEKERMERLKLSVQARKKMKSQSANVDFSFKEKEEANEEKMTLLLPQVFKVKPTKFMTLEEYYKRQAEKAK
eukprot:augustus_masked-scaffold_8-processed-gene-9.8-mRNA-1 protein AED:1.00 eAED:1.00 QI:0/-1/0/0/-1/1/1/0/518